MNRVLAPCAAALMLSGCTAVDVRPVATQSLDTVCIVNNPAVIVDDFVDVVRDGFSRHGIATHVVQDQSAPDCPTTLTYTARRSWDMAPYLVHAEMRLWQGGRQIGYGEYHLRGKGGFALTKWQGTRTKMDPVLDQMLEGAASAPGSTVVLPPPPVAPQQAASVPAAPSGPMTLPSTATTPPAAPAQRERDPAKRCDACQRIGKDF